MRWYLVIRRVNTPPRLSPDILGEHFTWLRAQHDSGTIVMSGPSADRALGLYVMRARSRDEAIAAASGDPLARDGRATIEVIEWDVHQIAGAGPFTLEALGAMESGTS
jgi:uncharacterized protein YciI